MNTVSHLAGPPITISGRTLQRCLICGDKLLDSLGTAAPEGPDGTPPAFHTWPAGRCVRVTPGNPSRSVLLEDAEKLPDDSCIDLVES